MYSLSEVMLMVSKKYLSQYMDGTYVSSIDIYYDRDISCVI